MPAAKISPERIEKLTNLIRLGCWLETAAEASGIGRLAFRLWLKRGNVALALRDKGKPIPKSETLYLDLVEKVHQASAESEVRDIERIDKAAEEIWQASAWRLERRYPERWGKREEHRVVSRAKTIVQIHIVEEPLAARHHQNGQTA